MSDNVPNRQPDAEQRRDELLRRLLKTPPQPRQKRERGPGKEKDGPRRDRPGSGQKEQQDS